MPRLNIKLILNLILNVMSTKTKVKKEKATDIKTIDADASELKALLADKDWLQIPKKADVVKGTIISVSRNEIRVDINGYKTGVVRGRELFEETA